MARRPRIDDRFFDRLRAIGWAEVEKWELYAWFDKQRLTSRDMDRLQDDWEDYFGRDAETLYLIKDGDEQKWLFMTASAKERMAAANE